MSDEDEDGDNDFFQVEDQEPISRGAFTLNSFALVESVNAGTPGWIGDDWLSAIPAETTIAAVELEAIGKWTREGDGYHIDEPELMAMLIAQNDKFELGRRECEEAGEHIVVGKPGQRHCTRCFAPLDRIPPPPD
jgi:hypothetical protein